MFNEKIYKGKAEKKKENEWKGIVLGGHFYVEKHVHPAYFQEKTYFQEKNNFHELLYCTLLNRIVGFEY